jgi:hypothetical protein
MNTENNESSKDILKEEINNLKGNAKKIKEKGREAVEYGQSIDDIADATLGILNVTKKTPSLGPVLEDFRILNEQTRKLITQFWQIDFNPVDSSTGTTNLSISSSFHPNLVLPLNDKSSHKKIIDKYHRIEELTQKNANEAEIMNLMKDFGLDKSIKGDKSALEQFQIAQEAFKKPVKEENPASTSLVPMRECLRTTIDHLLRRRPKQEVTKREEEKIISIGMQLKGASISQNIICSLADKWKTILRDLSSSKEESISREEWQYRLNQATIFLKSFLTALDPQKCR